MKAIYTMTVLSDCHVTDKHWTPEPFSKLGREQAVHKMKACHQVQAPVTPAQRGGYVKQMKWPKGKASELRRWRESRGTGMDVGHHL